MSIQNLKYFGDIGFRILTGLQLVLTGISIVERWVSGLDEA